MKIYCPKCEWKPDAASRWVCDPQCKHSWNTFDTRGVCPKCNKKHQFTQCLSCAASSPHEQWYHDDDSLSEDNLDAFYMYITEELTEPIAAPPA